MLSSTDIRGITFSHAVGGYKKDEVEVLLDKVEADYEQNERTIRALQDEIERLKREIEGYKESQNSIQTVLLNAQKLADQMVNEARQKSAEILGAAQQSVDNFAAREKELTLVFEEKAEQRKNAVEKEIDTALQAAKNKSNAMVAAAEDAVSRQQLLFDKLKVEISAFKADITRKYKEHLEILQKLPDTVSMEPKAIAEAVASEVDNVPSAKDFVNKEQTAQNVVSQPEADPTAVDDEE